MHKIIIIMKKKYFPYAASIVLSVAMLTGCELFRGNRLDSSKSDQTNAETETLVQPVDNDDSAIKQSYQLFKKEAEEKIIEYEKNIAEIKVRISTEKSETKAKYEEKLHLLEQKNRDLKTKIVDVKDEELENWETFKANFKKDMDELGNSFANFFTKEE
jgi:hypothetical protein